MFSSRKVVAEFLRNQSVWQGFQHRWATKASKPAERVILHKDIVETDWQRQLREKELFNRQREALGRHPETDEILVDMPPQNLEDPYAKPMKKCILCELDVKLDYKNTRLLSQFVSPYTGQIYGRKDTGLCIYMQKRVALLIKRAREFGYMPYAMKNPRYLKDPKLFGPTKKR